MLDSIEIKNFKRIGEEGLKLNNLKQVNYLVGENGSGKSSVLECLYIFSFDSDILYRETKNKNRKSKQFRTCLKSFIPYFPFFLLVSV